MDFSNPNDSEKIVSIILLTAKNQVLLQKKDGSYPTHPFKWCLFGGGVEKDETPLEAIKREIETEELGISLQNPIVLGTFSYRHFARKKNGHMTLFLEKFDGDMSKLRLREGAGFALFEESEIHSLPMIPHNKKILLEAFARIKKRL